MKSNETTTLTLLQIAQEGARKCRQLLAHPFTLIVLVWSVLLLAFYVLSEFF